MSRIVNADELPRPSGFSHAVVASAGDTVYLAGQIGDGETIAEQFDNAAANLLTALRATGGEPGGPRLAPGLRHRRRRVQGCHWPTSASSGASTSAATTRRWGCSGSPSCSSPTAKVELMGIAVLQA